MAASPLLTILARRQATRALSSFCRVSHSLTLGMWRSSSVVSCSYGRCRHPLPSTAVTILASPTGMAASFNRTSWYLKGEVMGNEHRALHNLNVNSIGVTGYGPNINMVKVRLGAVRVRCRLSRHRWMVFRRPKRLILLKVCGALFG
jgi:hypothetical protein